MAWSVSRTKDDIKARKFVLVFCVFWRCFLAQLVLWEIYGHICELQTIQNMPKKIPDKKYFSIIKIMKWEVWCNVRKSRENPTCPDRKCVKVADYGLTSGVLIYPQKWSFLIRDSPNQSNTSGKNVQKKVFEKIQKFRLWKWSFDSVEAFGPYFFSTFSKFKEIDFFHEPFWD